MKRFLVTLAAGTALLGGASAANATTTAVQTFSFGTPATTDFDNSVSFALFDTNLGTLQSITISGSYGITSTVTVQNNASSASSGNVSAEGFLQYGSSNSAIQSVLDNLINTQGTVTQGSTTELTSSAFQLLGGSKGYNLAAGANTTVSSSKSPQTISPITDTTTSDFSAFEAAGGGTANLDADTFTTTVLSNNGGNTAASQVTTGTAAFSIYYTYSVPTGVPEPASMALLGAGLVGAGLVRRRSR